MIVIAVLPVFLRSTSPRKACICLLAMIKVSKVRFWSAAILLARLLLRGVIAVLDWSDGSDEYSTNTSGAVACRGADSAKLGTVFAVLSL